MRIRKKDILVFTIVFAIGTILGTIGTISFPIGTNMSYFWPAAAIQTVSGLFFGIWGVLAGTLFPCFSNAITDGTLSHIVGLIPANFVQSFIPLWIKKTTKFSPLAINWKTTVIFIVGCAILPHLIGGLVGCTTLYICGDIPNGIEFYRTLKVWTIGNIPCSIIFGIILLRTLSILDDCELYYRGYFA